MAKKIKDNTTFSNLIGGIIDEPSTPAPIDAPHEAAAPEMEATKEEVPAHTSTGAKRGRPAATTAPDEVNVTFKISASLFQEIRVKAVMEHTTQKEIVNAALRQYLNK